MAYAVTAFLRKHLPTSAAVGLALLVPYTKTVHWAVFWHSIWQSVTLATLVCVDTMVNVLAVMSTMKQPAYESGFSFSDAAR
jgi:hypothetical protein